MEAAQLLKKSEELLNNTRDSIQRVEVIEEDINVEEENVEVPLYEVHSILVTLSSSYLVQLAGLTDLIAQKHKRQPRQPGQDPTRSKAPRRSFTISTGRSAP